MPRFALILFFYRFKIWTISFNCHVIPLFRYSSRGSISRLTPPTWKYLLRTSNLTQLRTLSIPVLYQPGLHPDTQVREQGICVTYFHGLLLFLHVFFHWSIICLYSRNPQEKPQSRAYSPLELSFWHKLKFLIPISIQPNGVNLWYFKLRLFDLTDFIVWNV